MERGEGDPSKLRGKLAALSRNHHVALDSAGVARLVLLDELLERWGKAVPLVGFQTRSERHDRYFLEAVHASRWLPEEGEALDIGSGGGTPGLPFALARPGLRWTLLEPSRRKCVFLEEAVGRLELENVIVERARWERYEPRDRLVAVTTRGVGLGSEFFLRAAEWLDRGARLLVITGSERLPRIAEETRLGFRFEGAKRLAPRGDARLGVWVRR